MSEYLSKKWLLPGIAAAGLLIAILFVKLQPSMVHTAQQQPAVPVSTIKVTSHMIRPAITGFGVVAPDLKLQAKAEVSGRITYIHPGLKKGEIIPQGTLVLTIDDQDYRLALEQSRSDLLAAQAALKELELNVENNKLELKLANEKLKVREDELKRFQKLKNSGSVSQSRLDQEKQTLLQQRQEVQQLENQRSTLPSDIAVQKTKIDIARSRVEQSQRDLDRTLIKLPFDARIATVSVEKEQYVAKGNPVFDAVGITKVTINAQFPIDQFRYFSSGIDRSKINTQDWAGFPGMSRLLTDLGLTAKVELAGSSFKPWQAKVERFSDSLDLQSRTVGVIVSVTGSYQQAEPGIRPPLLEGMYMQVTLQGKAQEYLALPRFALHGEEVFRLAENNTLQRIALDDLQLQGELALLKQPATSGLVEDDSVIVSDVFPAINGMKTSPRSDNAVSSQLQQWVEAAQ
ncbi:efflux RND transporter periplasmic adaptor subunit [Spongorhabdus nitratireducens]